MEKAVIESKAAGAHKAEDSAVTDLSIRGRFQQYLTPFTQVVLPMLSLRYLLQAFEEINYKDIFRKKNPSELNDGTPNPDHTPWKKPPIREYAGRNSPAIGMGLLVSGILFFYSKRTYADIKTLYAESIGYELGKKPEEVGFRDIFFRSQNKAVEVTAGAFVKRTIMRALAAASFLFPWQVFRPWKNVQPKYDANLSAGVGIMGLHIAGESFLRSPSYFDVQQGLLATAINHSGINTREIINTEQIESLLLLQRKHIDKNYKWPKLNSTAAENETILADRIADLLNQTYNNTRKTGHADFTIGKFNYLVGFGLLDAFPTSMAFVELANTSSDMKQVNAAAEAIKKGQNPVEVFRQFGIELQPSEAEKSILSTPLPEPGKFAGAITPAMDRMPKEQRDIVDFAIKSAEGSVGRSGV